MRKPTSVETLNKLGRVQLSPHFFMRDMLYSEIANFHGIQNIPDNPDLAIKAGKRLCNELLEPLRATFGHVSIRSAYRSHEVNKRGNEEMKAGKNGYNCALDNDARHTWDRLDKGFMGATACIVIPWFARRYEEGTPWYAMAWWIHDHRDRLPYSEICFYPVYAAFNIRWYGGKPEHIIKSYMQPRLLTKPDCGEDHLKDHSSEYPGFPELVLP